MLAADSSGFSVTSDTLTASLARPQVGGCGGRLRRTPTQQASQSLSLATGFWQPEPVQRMLKPLAVINAFVF